MTTIFSPITAYGKCGVTIIRISGPQSRDCLKHLGIKQSLKNREATLSKIVDLKTEEIVDKPLITFFPSPNSFTGEDVIEINLHASPYIIKRTLELLSEVKDCRFAEAGEFSKRAFLNGKMDLVQADAIVDLIEAETKEQHKQSMRQMEGELGKIYDSWRTELIEITAHIEAFIDFPDEDLPQNIIDDLENKVKKLIQDIKNHINDGNRGEKIKNGLSLAILGAPNVGKSSLINHLAQSEVAIVSDIAGTTRDIVQTHLSIAGLPVIISDTAGIRETEDLIEKEGVRRALNKASEADLKLLIFNINDLSALDQKTVDLIDDSTIVIINKIDLKKAEIPALLAKNEPLLLSIKENLNLDKLLKKLEEKVRKFAPTSESPLITRARYRESLNKTIDNLSEFSLEKNIEFAAEDLRLAIREIGKITGKVGVDDILDVIFGDFCIGK